MATNMSRFRAAGAGAGFSPKRGAGRPGRGRPALDDEAMEEIKEAFGLVRWAPEQEWWSLPVGAVGADFYALGMRAHCSSTRRGRAPSTSASSRRASGR